MSKGLEALEDLRNHLKDDVGHINIFDKLNLNLIEKELKALEIIKKKKVNIHSWYYNECNKMPYEIYKQSIMAKTISSELLIQEEFNLLKEVLL